MIDGQRLAADLSALAASGGARQSQLDAPSHRPGIHAQSGRAAEAAGGSGGGGGGDLSEDANRIRTLHGARYLTSTDGLFVFEIHDIATLPMLNSIGANITLAFLDR